MGRLIIAEKHSVAQAIAAALGGGKAEDGWIGCGADAVTWAQGHLVDLLTPDEYQDRGWDKWSMDALPLDPTGGWKWKVNRQRGADRQYRVVAGLLKSDEYDVLVNACDPDREGESIFHRIVSHAGTRKPMLRLWVASLEEDAIRDALDSMRSEDEYRGLAEAADIRAKADWLIGMNASRAYTLVYHRRMSVGRVQTPTLAMVADRDRQIAHHVEKPFWKVVVPMGGWTLTGERLDDRTDAEALKSIVDAPDFTFQVFSVQRRTVHERPPRLYDLTGLQKDMSRLHGLTAARTLAALQSLYEKKLATYPRTDSQYITHDDLDTLRDLAKGPGRVDGFVRMEDLPSAPRFDLTVDDTKVSGHTAILPTRNVDRTVLDGLSGDDGRNYQTYKPIQDEYRQIRWKGKQEKFAEARRAELTLWDAANRYLHAHLPEGVKTLPISAWEKEYTALKAQREAEYDTLKETRAEVAELQKIRRCVDIVLRADQPEQTQNRAKRHEQER